MKTLIEIKRLTDIRINNLSIEISCLEDEIKYYNAHDAGCSIECLKKELADKLFEINIDEQLSLRCV